MSFIKSLKPKNKKEKYSPKKEWKCFFLGLIMLIFFVICGVIYIGQVNIVATRGFKFKDIEIELQKEREINQELKLESAQLKAIDNLKKSIDNLEMIKVTKVDYISAVDSTAMAR